MSISSVNSGLMSNANSSQWQEISMLLTSMENQPTLLDILYENSGNSTSCGDLLSLSDQGQSAADQLLIGSWLSSMQTAADKAGASIQTQLNAVLSQNGIDTSQEIDLQVDASGKVVVSNDNPQKQQIEDTINNNANLKKAVVQYLKFMQTIAPTLENGNTLQTALSPGLGELLSLLSSQSGSNGTQGTVTLAIQGNGFATLYQDSGTNPVLLSSSQGLLS